MRKNQRRRKAVVKQNQMACIKETYSFDDLKPNQAYTTFINIEEFPRALDIADNFQEYRISKVEFRFIPKYDTYVDASGTTSLPNLYLKRQIYTPPTTFGLPYLQAMGAKPIRFDDKVIKYAYTPNINLWGTQGTQPTIPVSNVPSLMPKYKPWLSTHQINALSPANTQMDNTPHLGHVFWLEQTLTSGGATTIGEYEITAYFEFRKPWDLAAVQATDPEYVLTQKKKKVIEQ